MQSLIEWQPFNTENKASVTFNQFIDIVKQLDNNTSPDLWLKWKNYAHQVVIETPNYFYKIYLLVVNSLLKLEKPWEKYIENNTD